MSRRRSHASVDKDAWMRLWAEFACEPSYVAPFLLFGQERGADSDPIALPPGGLVKLARWAQGGMRVHVGWSSPMLSQIYVMLTDPVTVDDALCAISLLPDFLTAVEPVEGAWDQVHSSRASCVLSLLTIAWGDTSGLEGLLSAVAACSPDDLRFVSESVASLARRRVVDLGWLAAFLDGCEADVQVFFAEAAAVVLEAAPSGLGAESTWESLGLPEMSVH